MMKSERKHRIRRLNCQGNVAIETALLFPVFFVFIGMIFDVSMLTYTRLQAESVVSEVGRKAITGQTPIANANGPAERQYQLEYLLRSSLHQRVIRPASCRIFSQKFGRIGEISSSAPPESTVGMFGQSGDILKLGAVCRYNFFFPFSNFLQLENYSLYRVTTFVFIEPY